MSRLSWRRARVTCAAVLSLSATAAHAADFARRSATLHVTAAQVFAIGDAAVAKGDTVTAKRAYSALTNDPSTDVRVEARFRLAMLERKSGNLTRAAILLRQVVDDRPHATRARLELAGILDRMGDKNGAWRQLRAAQASGLPLSVARLVDRYSAALGAQRPLGATFGIALAPDSNINRATRSDTLDTVIGDFTISDDAKPKSGTGLAVNGQAFRRFAVSDNASLLIRLSGFANLYRRKDFNDVAADLAIGPELDIGSNRLQLEIAATQRWFGQKKFVRSARVAGVVSRPVGSRMLIRVSGSAELVDNQMNNLQDGHAYSGQIGLERALTATTGVAARLGMDRQALKDPGYATTSWRAGVTGWHDLGRATLTTDAEFGRLWADERLLLFPMRRVERWWRLSLAATFRQLQLSGFAPVVRFSLERNRSTIAFYDYRRARTEFGIERAF